MNPPREEHARRLGARPMPLNAYEVAEYRRPVRWGRLALEIAVLGLAGWALACAVSALLG